MRRRKLYRGLAVAFSAILLATSNPATLQNVAAKRNSFTKKSKGKDDPGRSDGEWSLYIINDDQQRRNI